MKELKNKVDSIRRTLKNQNITVSSQEIENKILELCPSFPDDWCSDIRTEIIKALTNDNQSTELATTNSVNDLQAYDNATEESYVNSIDTDVNSIDNDELSDIQELPEVTAIAPQDAPQESSQLTISDADKQALVASQSMALGFTLTEDETTEIADSIDDVFSDYSSFISSVTSAIKGYIAHKFDAIEDELEANTEDVREYLSDRTNQLNRKVANYAESVRAIKDDTQTIRNNLKTSKDAVLSRFRVGILTS